MQTTTIHPHDYKGYQVRSYGFMWTAQSSKSYKEATTLDRLYKLIDESEKNK